MNKEKKEVVKVNQITEGVIWQQILIFFLPILFGTFFQQLYNTVDTWVVGNYVSNEAFSAVGTVGSTLGITTKLSAVSRVIIILLMYAGRLGGMSFVLLFTERRSDPPLERPAGKILIG